MTFQETMNAKNEFASNLEAELNNSTSGFVMYKASKVVASHSGWFSTACELRCAPSMQELLFDLDFLQINIDYDADKVASLALLNEFKSFTGSNF